MPFAYYNEFDKSAAEWLRQLIKEGAITDGVVDERSIEDVVPTELAEFDRCHFFAGIGAWDYALTAAGWRDGDGQTWTGSCPCQPFSSAGKGEGFADERHLWPAWFHLIEQCRPRVIFGEQVSSKDTMPWIDLVHADLESALYTVGAADLCSPSVGAPHIRQRLYFVAESERQRELRSTRNGISTKGTHESRRSRIRIDEIGNGGSTHDLADAASIRHDGYAEIGRENGRSQDEGRLLESERSSPSDELAKPVSVGRRGRSDGDTPGNGGEIQTEGRGGIGQLADADRGRLERPETGRGKGRRSDVVCEGSISELAKPVSVGRRGRRKRPDEREICDSRCPKIQTSGSGDISESGRGGEIQTPGRGPTNGFWRNAEWIYCRDGKYRPVGTVEPGSFEVADVTAADLGYLWDQGRGRYTISPLIEKGRGRVVRLRGYGNAIVPEVAIEWIKSYLDR